MKIIVLILLIVLSQSNWCIFKNERKYVDIKEEMCMKLCVNKRGCLYTNSYSYFNDYTGGMYDKIEI